MMNLTIPVDSILLTPEEVSAITGRSRKAQQAEWLKEHGWKFTRNAANDPIVGRLYATLKLAGQELGGVSIQAGLPDFRDKFNYQAPVTWLHNNINNFLFTKKQIIDNSVPFKLADAPACCGVYFLILNEDIKYVGISNNICSRFVQHRNNGKKPSKFFHIEIDEMFMRDLESLYINEFKPEWNEVYPPASLGEYASLIGERNE